MITIADRLYAVLATMPCSCTMKWIDGKHIIVKMCSRCRAINEYNEEMQAQMEEDYGSPKI